jgi:3-hydroxybutyryl-CoA dehydrogenase
VRNTPLSHEPSCVAIIGGGTMGGDIAIIFAAGGWKTSIVEPLAKTRKTLPARLSEGLQILGAEHAMDLFSIHANLEAIHWDRIEIAVECVSEDLLLKQKIFAQLEKLSRASIPITSNSSGLPISRIGKGLSTRARMLGLHFFMPAHIVPLVEIVCSEATDPSIAEHVSKVMESLDKRPVFVKRDIPGFLANRIQHALMREAISLVERGIATAEDVDVAVRFGFGFRYVAAGPLLQKDFSGLDTQRSAAAAIYPDLCNATTPSAYLNDMVSTGNIGIRTKKGFYNWTDAKIKKERVRYQKALLAALRILKD